MFIFYQLLPHCCRCCLVVVVVVGVSTLLLASQIWRLVVEGVVVGVSLSFLSRCCRQRCPFSWLHSLASTPCCRRRFVAVVSDGVTPIKTNIYFCSLISTSNSNRQTSIQKSFITIIFATDARIKQQV